MYRPRSTPYGDIFQVNTSHIDEMANRLYAQERQRELLKRQGDANLDNEFAKELVGIKKADIPEVTQKWAKFRQAHINNQKKGAKATPEDQYAVLQSKADFFSSIAASKEDKERIKNRTSEIKADKKGRYKLDSHSTLANMLNTPTSQRKVDEDDALLFNQYSFPDLPKVAANMVGKPQEIKIGTGKPSVKGDLYDDENVFQRFNNPNQMFNNGFYEISTRPDRENYERVVLDSLNDKEKEDLTIRYLAKINSPEFKAVYGDVQPFPETAEKTELGKAVALSVMSAVDKLPITPLRTESKTNQNKLMDRKWDEKLTWGAIQQQRKERNIRLNKEGGSGFYEIDNIPLKLEENAKSVDYINPSTGKLETADLVDITDFPTSQKDDILGKKNDKGMYENRPIVNQGRQYLKVTPDGYEGAGNFKVTDKDIYINTHKRTVSNFEKPKDLKKMKVRGTAQGGGTGTKKQGEADDL